MSPHIWFHLCKFVLNWSKQYPYLVFDVIIWLVLLRMLLNTISLVFRSHHAGSTQSQACSGGCKREGVMKLLWRYFSHSAPALRYVPSFSLCWPRAEPQPFRGHVSQNPGSNSRPWSAFLWLHFSQSYLIEMSSLILVPRKNSLLSFLYPAQFFFFSEYWKQLQLTVCSICAENNQKSLGSIKSRRK